jgi:hypothetical protein
MLPHGRLNPLENPHMKTILGRSRAHFNLLSEIFDTLDQTGSAGDQFHDLNGTERKVMFTT